MKDLINTYPYFPGIKGIAPEVFSQPKEEVIVTESKRPVLANIDKNRFELIDMEFKDLHLKAHRYASGIINIEAYTKSALLPNGRHPDFYPNRFIKTALLYFDKIGQPINKYECLWYGNSINFSQFFSVLESLGDKKEAARRTWEGQIAILNGFKNLQHVQVNGTKDNPNALITSIFGRN